MRAIETSIYAALGVALCDWIFVGRMAAYFTDFDYRYWPPTWPRAITLLLVAVATSASVLTFTPGSLPVWLMLIWAVAFGLWMVVAVDDIGRQRALGYRRPPRYSDADE